MTTQNCNEWSDVKEVNDHVSVNIAFELKRLGGQKINEWLDVKKVDNTA